MTFQTTSYGLPWDRAVSKWNMPLASSKNRLAVGSSSWQSNESSTRCSSKKLHWPKLSPHGPPTTYVMAAWHCSMGPSPESDRVMRLWERGGHDLESWSQRLIRLVLN